MFDHVFVFHPGTEAAFHAAGHPQVWLLGHAVDACLYREWVPHTARRYDVAHVGTTIGPYYARRRRLLAHLEGRFHGNDWHRRYEPWEVPSVYRQSRVVVNIGRDWWPGDANLRCFEAMAAGAVLVTYMPSELEGFGFREGLHFIGFEREEDVPEIVASLLRDADARERIALAARDKMLREHTWVHRAAKLLDVLHSGSLVAPARCMSAAEVSEVYLDFYLGHRDWGGALRAGLSLGARSPVRLAQAARVLASRAVRRAVRGSGLGGIGRD